MRDVRNAVRRFVPDLTVFAVTLLVAGLFARYGVNDHEDGILFKPAVDLLHGQMLFRDSFTQYGALTTILQALALSVAGERLLVIRELTALFYAMSAVLLYRLWSRFLPAPLVIASWAAWLLTSQYLAHPFAPWSSVYAEFFLLLAALSVIADIERPSSPALFAAGVATALAFWCRQPVGVFLSCAIVVTIPLVARRGGLPLRQSLARLVPFIAGEAVVSGIFLLWLWRNDALADWWIQSIEVAGLWARTHGRGVGLRNIVTKLFPPHMPLVWTIVPLACLGAAVATSISLVRKHTHELLAPMVFAVICLASWLQYFPIADGNHVHWGATPAFGLVAWVLWRTVPQGIDRRWRTVAAAVLLLALFGTEIVAYATRAVTKLRVQHVRLEAPVVPAVLDGMHVDVTAAATYRELARVLGIVTRMYPDIGIVTYRFDALPLTFVRNSPNYHPLYINWTWISDVFYPDMPFRRDAYIRRTRPLIIADADRRFDGYGIIASFDRRTGCLFAPVVR